MAGFRQRRPEGLKTEGLKAEGPRTQGAEGLRTQGAERSIDYTLPTPSTTVGSAMRDTMREVSKKGLHLLDTQHSTPQRPGGQGAETPGGFRAMTLAERRAKIRAVKLTEEDLLQLQFAFCAEELRKVAFYYLNRPVTLADGEEEPLDDEIPPVGTYSQSQALVQFAQDMRITPTLLLTEEVNQAVMDSYQRRLKHLHIPDSMERAFVDFLVVCAQKAMGKKPYINVFGHSTLKQKVRAMLEFLPLRDPEALDPILAMRFPAVNHMAYFELEAESEMKKAKQQPKKWTDIETARRELTETWKRVHEIFLFFCDRPEVVGPDIDKHTKLDTQPLSPLAPQDSASSVTASLDDQDTQPEDPEGPTEPDSDFHIKVEMRELVEFHPAMLRAKRIAAAIKLQHWFRKRKHLAIDRLASGAWYSARAAGAIKHRLNRNRAEGFGESKSQPTQPSVDKVSVLVKMDHLHYGAASDKGSEFSSVAESEALDNSEVMITRPVEELLEWKRKVIDNDELETAASVSSAGSGSTIGFKKMTILNDRTGAWADTAVMLKKPRGLTPKSLKGRPPRPGDTQHSTLSSGRGSASGTPLLSTGLSATQGGVRVSPLDRRNIMKDSLDISQVSSLAHTRAEAVRRRPLSARSTSHTLGAQHLPSHRRGSLTERGITSSGANMLMTSGPETPILNSGRRLKGLRSTAPPEKKKYSVFSDNPVERRKAMDAMFNKDVRYVPKMEITQKDLDLREKVEASWLSGARHHDKEFEKAASKIQKMGRAWMTRKIVREGIFLREGRKAWIEANPPPPLNSSVAEVSFDKLMALCRTFHVTPTVIEEADLLQFALTIIQKSERRISGRAAPVMKLRWREFQEVLWLTSRKVHDVQDETSELEALSGLEELLKRFLEGSDETVDMEGMREWIKERVLQFAYTQHREKKKKAEGVRRTKKAHLQIKTEAAASVSDGSAVYLNACAQMEVQPIHSLLRQLPNAEINLEHYGLVGPDMAAFSSGIQKSNTVQSLRLCDARLDSDGQVSLFSALTKNTCITSLDLSENFIDKISVQALGEMLLTNTTINRLILRGCDLDDDRFDLLVRSGLEKNRALIDLDIGYNLLSDQSLDHIEHMIMTKAAMVNFDLSWNLFSKDGVKRIHTAGVERSKPRSTHRAKGRIIRQLPKVNLIAPDLPIEQRIHIARAKGLSGLQKWELDTSEVMSQADFISMDVILRDRKLDGEMKFRIARMMTSGKSLEPDQVCRLLKVFFAAEEPTLRSRATQDMLDRLLRPEDVVVVAHELRGLGFEI